MPNPQYVEIHLNLGAQRRANYLAKLRKRYNRPKMGWSRLIMLAIREVLDLESNGVPIRGKETT